MRKLKNNIIYKGQTGFFMLISSINKTREIIKNLESRIPLYMIANFWAIHTHLQARSFLKKSHFGNPIFVNFVKS